MKLLLLLLLPICYISCNSGEKSNKQVQANFNKICPFFIDSLIRCDSVTIGKQKLIIHLTGMTEYKNSDTFENMINNRYQLIRNVVFNKLSVAGINDKVNYDTMYRISALRFNSDFAMILYAYYKKPK